MAEVQEVVGKVDKVAKAKADMEAEQRVAKSKGGVGEKKTADDIDEPEPVVWPDYLRPVAFCQVGVAIDGLKKEHAIIVRDPGFKLIGKFGLIQSDDPEQLAQAYEAMARAISKFELPAFQDSEELGVVAGEPLPFPKSLIAEHLAQWKEYRSSAVKASRRNMELRKEFGADAEFAELPDPPESKLEQLLVCEIPTSVFQRLCEGIQYAVRPEGPEEAKGGNS